MDNQIRNPQSLGPLHFRDKILPRKIHLLFIKTAQVDQVRSMHTNGFHARAFFFRFKFLNFLIRQRFDPPLLLVLGENLNDVTGDVLAVLRRIKNTVGNRNMGAEFHIKSAQVSKGVFQRTGLGF